VQPATGRDFALVLPHVSTGAMQEFLDAFARRLRRREHAVVALDRAGWHVARALRVPANVTLVRLPPYAPELNPVERVWLYLRERRLSHRVLDGYAAIVDALCHARRQLSAHRLKSLTNYPYIEQVNC
jgi:transposase